MVLVLLRQGGPAMSGKKVGGSRTAPRIAALELRVRLLEEISVQAACPWCGRKQAWWGPGQASTRRGLDCFDVDCGFMLDFPPGPPAILCSRCDEELEPGDGCYRCRWCRREVRPPKTAQAAT